ncbi:hypothetical protein C0Z18_04205 [Trinickia dabaoshanensis]|uniref:Uncharacterized protein n=1 Tax=Trinickia dabaoshanensis TaxID=564714 RepID=A0A2N7VZH0_9BURK|nr:hypothetical protein C0Z18_04205 [Trinickia dabaoshanensis]
MGFRVDPHRPRPRRAGRPQARGEQRVGPDLPEVVRAEIAQQLHDAVRTEVVRQLHEPQCHTGAPNARPSSISQQDLFEIHELQNPSQRNVGNLPTDTADGTRSPLRPTDPRAIQEHMRRETLAAFGLDPDDPSL